MPHQETKVQRITPLALLLVVATACIGVIIFYFGFYMYALAHGMPRADTQERLVWILAFSFPFFILAYVCIRKILKIKNEDH